MSPILPLFLLLVGAHHQAAAQSWLTREERQHASQIKMTYRRPASQIPTCGTSDPGVMQMMMLPAAAFGDIMMTNVMHPIMDMFTGPQNRETGRQEESGRSSQSSSTSSWRVSPPQSRKRPKSRRDWRRDLGQGQKQAEDKKEGKKRRKKRSVSLYSYSPWLTNNIPYVLSPNLNRDDRLTISKAMESIERGSCVKFVPRGFSPYYVHIARECSCGSRRCAFNGAYANIGPGVLPGLPSRMRILTCLAPNDEDAVGIITHELLHNMGMLHTHTRLDRGEHVHVNYLNVLPDKWIDYSWNPLQFPLDTEYDCDSIMHYRDTSFNIGNSITLEAVDPSRCRLRSRSNRPTSADIDLINKLYNC